MRRRERKGEGTDTRIITEMVEDVEGSVADKEGDYCIIVEGGSGSRLQVERAAVVGRLPQVLQDVWLGSFQIGIA